MNAQAVSVVALPGHFAQVQLSGLREIVDHHRADGHAVQFDANDVERIDGAAVQFLLAVSKLQSAADSSAALVINANDVLTNALDDMGVLDLIKTDASSDQGIAEQPSSDNS